MTEEIVPQWKRELIQRRRAIGRAASVGPLQFTCPGVVSAQRQPDLSPGMRLPSAVSDIQHLLTQIEAERKPKMGEEKVKKTITSADSRRDEKSPDEENMSDSSEEFKYGPGIVSKLKSKYLSLTLREAHVKVRPSLANMRRATSLENLLDEPDKSEEIKQSKFVKNANTTNGSAFQSRRGISRNKESMKRARSVEALMRYNRNLEQKKGTEDELIVVESDRSRNRLSLEEKELPPPDLVKQTLKLFEPSVNAKPFPQLLKSPLIPKGVVPSTKPVISPKPVTLDKTLWEPKTKPVAQNGNDSSVDLRFEKIGETKFRQRNTELASPESPRLVKEIMKIPEVKIIEKLPIAKVVIEDKPVISIKETPKVKKDEVDLSNTKEKPSVKIEIKSPLPVDHSSPKEIQKKPEEILIAPTVKPRSPLKPVERRHIVVAPSTPILETSVGASHVIPRSPEVPFSPGSQMKQVGVIRPIVTNKSPPVSHTPPKFAKSNTDRELEKNYLNKVKSVEQPVTKVIVSLKKSAEECTISPPKPHEEKPSPGSTWAPKAHSMVFNFSDRKEVPDYIENDGLILTSKKERPKRGDGGIILLAGGTADSSTDYEVEEAVGPQSPCELVIIGGNVLINGKSSLQKTPKRINSRRVTFNDEATTFEYPSESSMLDDSTDISKSSPNSSSSLNLPLRSGTLSSYTPSQLVMGSEFQLGVTKSQPPVSQPPRHIDSSDEEDYLRPADNASTVAWSADTAADLLF